MSKIITSPVKRWAGTVTIADPLTLPQAEAFEIAIQTETEIKWLTDIDKLYLPVVLACVEKWDLQNFTPDPFPFSPRKASHELIAWIFNAIKRIYLGEIEVPNESSPTLTATQAEDSAAAS